MLTEYLKLARSFNMSLTGLAPVMGALAVGQTDPVVLLLLFLVGCLGHAYGFAHNDIVDLQHDSSVAAIASRPLVKGSISRRGAWLFALGTLAVAFVLVGVVSVLTRNYWSVFLFLPSAVLVTAYNYLGKRIVFMDILLAVGMFFLILWGATASTPASPPTLLAWIVCLLGAIQVLYMNVIAGGIKDIEHDALKRARTTAVWLGARSVDDVLRIPPRVFIVAFALQAANITVAFLPVVFSLLVEPPSILLMFQGVALSLIATAMVGLVWKLLTLQRFERPVVRRLIGAHYYLNFCLAPLLLLAVTVWAGLIVIIPVIGFAISNALLHEKFMEPEVM